MARAASANREVNAPQTRTRSKRPSLGIHGFHGIRGGQRQVAPLTDKAVRARTNSTISTLGRYRKRPQGSGPFRAEFDGERKLGAHALWPSSLAIMSTSTLPRRASTSFRSLRRGSPQVHTPDSSTASQPDMRGQKPPGVTQRKKFRNEAAAKRSLAGATAPSWAPTISSR